MWYFRFTSDLLISLRLSCLLMVIDLLEDSRLSRKKRPIFGKNVSQQKDQICFITFPLFFLINKKKTFNQSIFYAHQNLGSVQKSSAASRRWGGK